MLKDVQKYALVLLNFNYYALKINKCLFQLICFLQVKNEE